MSCEILRRDYLEQQKTLRGLELFYDGLSFIKGQILDEGLKLILQCVLKWIGQYGLALILQYGLDLLLQYGLEFILKYGLDLLLQYGLE